MLLGAAEPAAGPEVVLLETNLDDLNPELVPDAVERCFAAGALDVWTAPAQMKKGRPGIVLSALARPADERAVAAALLRGDERARRRVSRLRRYELEREERVVDSTAARSVSSSVGWTARSSTSRPSTTTAPRSRARTGRPVKAVWAAALARLAGPATLVTTSASIAMHRWRSIGARPR